MEDRLVNAENVQILETENDIQFDTVLGTTIFLFANPSSGGNLARYYVDLGTQMMKFVVD